MARYTQGILKVYSRCDRALAAASSNDLALSASRLDCDYHNWLRSCELGTRHIVNYDSKNSNLSLSDVIINDSSPVLKIAKELGKKPIYAPWFNGELEARAATAMGAEHFGASHDLRVRYNDKGKFKVLCEELGIPVIKGETNDTMAI